MANKSLQLDYPELIKLIPIGLGLNIFANSFVQTSINEIHYHIAFLVLFIVISLDSILEFGRYDYDVLPKSLKYLSFANGLVLTSLVISISFFSNTQLKDFSITMLFITLGLSSINEVLFSLFLGRALKKNLISDKSKIDYDFRDTKIYCLWEVMFTIVYFILSTKIFTDYFSVSQFLPWIGLIVLLIEIFVFNYFKEPTVKT